MAKESIGVVRQAATMAPRSSTSGGINNKVLTKNRASDRLEEDAQAMEERLVQLRMKMQEDKQKLEKDLPTKFGGARWRSAQDTIGSVSRYAKDVEDRIKKPLTKGQVKKKDKSADVDTGETKPPKKKKKKVEAAIVPSIATVKKWTTHHVLEWLTSLSLEEYHSAFEFHQVTGATLLTMEPGAFVDLGVARLSARNLLLKELERMKEAAATAVLRRGSLEAMEIIDLKIKDVALVPEMASPGKDGRGGVHWSHVQQLRDANGTTKQAELPVNLADGDFDEDAGHVSFMKALLDWRAGDGDDSDTDAKDKNNNNEMWFNPLMPSDNDPPNSGGGGALLEGEYDEAKEQDAFRRAVLAWRRTGTPTVRAETHSRPSTAGVEMEIERIEQGCATDQRKSCWQCYRIARADLLVRDAQTTRDFCGQDCLAAFQHEHARLYAKKME